MVDQPHQDLTMLVQSLAGKNFIIHKNEIFLPLGKIMLHIHGHLFIALHRCMSPVSQVFHTIEKVRIALKFN